MTTANPLGLSTEDQERAICSILMANPGILDSIPQLQAAHFSTESLRTLFGFIVKQQGDGKGCDPITLMVPMKGVMSLSELHEVAASHDHSAHPLRRLTQQVIDQAKARQLHGVSQVLHELAYAETPIADRLDQAQAAAAGLVEDAAEDDWVDAYEAAVAHSAVVEARENGQLQGIATGIEELDQMLGGGLQDGNLVIVGARPSMGKTAIALGIAQHAALKHPTLLLSMEMMVGEVMDRSYALLGDAKLSHVKNPRLGLDYQLVSDAIEQQRLRNLKISQRSGLNILQVKRMARSARRKFGMKLLVVDYVGLMVGTDPKQMRTYQIEEITRGLKELAKELGIAVLCLAQVNRDAADKPMDAPGLQDLKDSGAIEQDADVVTFVHRPVMIATNLGPEWKEYAMWKVAKNRQGPCGLLHMRYEGEKTRFTTWEGQPPTKGTAGASRGFGGTK